MPQQPLYRVTIRLVNPEMQPWPPIPHQAVTCWLPPMAVSDRLARQMAREWLDEQDRIYREWVANEMPGGPSLHPRPRADLLPEPIRSAVFEMQRES